MSDYTSPSTANLAGLFPAIDCEVEGQRFSIELDSHSAPRTVSALREALPMVSDVHCAKVAGLQLILPVPIVCGFEGNDDVVELPAGSIIYYPRRQFLEILLGPVQEFGGTANYIGRVQGNIETMLALCSKAIACAGRSSLWVSMSGPETHNQPLSSAHPDLLAIRKGLWAEMPAELWKLTKHFGAFGPIGPLLYAESELRKLHEFLWELRPTKGRYLIKATAGPIIDSTVRQLRDFFDLTENASLLERAWTLTCADTRDMPANFDELLLCVGRLSLWLDNILPWHSISRSSLSDIVEISNDPKLRRKNPADENSR
jgi:hypothetical protein